MDMVRNLRESASSLAPEHQFDMLMGNVFLSGCGGGGGDDLNSRVLGGVTAGWQCGLGGSVVVSTDLSSLTDSPSLEPLT